MKKLLILIIFLCVIPFVFSQSFDELEEPTSDDLLTVYNPTPNDFARLSPEEQQQYLLEVYSDSMQVYEGVPVSGFASSYLSSASFDDSRNKIIAEKYFSEDPTNINQHRSLFVDYMGSEGIDISLNGDVADFQSGILEGTYQRIDLNMFKNSATKDYYNIIVNADGSLSLMRKSGNRPVAFTGELIPARYGTFILSSGTINGVSIKNGAGLGFNSNGEITRGVAMEYNGIVFSEPAAIKTKREAGATVLQLQDAKITSVSEKTTQQITGSASVTNYDAVNGNLIVPAGQTFTVDGVSLTPATKPVTLEIDDRWWFEQYADSVATAFHDVQGEDYVQFILQDGNRVVEAKGDVTISFNSGEFVTGEKTGEQNPGLVDLSFSEARNDVAYRQGDKGENVRSIQRMLMSETNPETGIAYLAAGSDDGDYGPITASAVKAWQKNNNLEDDGKFGRQSLAVAQTAVEGVDDVVITPIASKAIVSTDGGALHIDVSSSSLQIGDTTFTGDGAKLLARRTADLEGSLEHPVDIRLRNEEGNVAGTFDLSKQGTASIIATPVGEYVADRIVGEGKELAVTTLDSALVAVGFKPYGAEMRTTIQHYVEGTGEPLDIGEIPQEFVDVIMEQTGGNPGTYEINPYTTRDYAVTHAFGHFYVSIPEEGSTGYMTDYYDFSMGSHSVAQGGAHGFQVASMPDEAVYVANNHVLPSTEFKSTGGKEIERVELTNVQVGDEQRTILFIPSEVLDKAGKPYQIRGTFQIPTRETSG